MPRRRAHLKTFVPLGDVLSRKLFGKRGETLLELYRLRKEWSSIVGSLLAPKTFAKRIEGDRLTVAVENPVWASQLSMMKEELLRAVSAKAGREFSDVRFVTEALPRPDLRPSPPPL